MSTTFGDLMPIEELASLTSVVLTWTSCLILQGILAGIKMITKDLRNHFYKKLLPILPLHLKIPMLNWDL